MMPRECKRLGEVDFRLAVDALTQPTRVREDAGAYGDLPP